MDCFYIALFLANRLDAAMTNSICEQLLAFMTTPWSNQKSIEINKSNKHTKTSNKNQNNNENGITFAKDKNFKNVKTDILNKINYNLKNNVSKIDNKHNNSNSKLSNKISLSPSQLHITTFWPSAIMCQLSNNSNIMDLSLYNMYCDVISTNVYSLVLRVLSHERLKDLYKYIECLNLPLLHLLLFYSYHCYIGILDFVQVEYYIINSVINGTKFQVI